MRKKRLLTLLLVPVFIIGTMVNFVGCGGSDSKNTDDSQTLEIFIGNFGYGTEWLNDEIEAFKNQDWVKRDYPDLNIPKPRSNSNRGFTTAQIEAGAKANSIDLFFTVQSGGNLDARDNKGNYLYDDLVDFYNSEVPGEGIKIKDKMKPDMLKSAHINRLDGTEFYYGVPWVDGITGLLVNREIVKELNGEDYVLPRTTDELVALAEKIKTAEQNKPEDERRTAIILSTKMNEWAQMFDIWWAQYDGVKSYENYFMGIDDNDQLSPEIFSQTGRLRSLEVVESLLSRKNGYTNTAVGIDFTVAQSRFFMGEGVMMANGDWIENEMRSFTEDLHLDSDIVFMKTPVISSIIEKCETVPDDGTLARIVQMINDGKSYEQTKEEIEDLSKKDYEKIREAGRINYQNEGHEARIPAYSKANKLAKDFLRFLATDEGISIFMKADKGVSTPYIYDVEKKLPEFSSFSNLFKNRIADAKDCIYLPHSTKFRLVNYGGLSALMMPDLEARFTAENVADKKTAEEIFNYDIEYYNRDGGAEFNSLLQRAGLEA